MTAGEQTTTFSNPKQSEMYLELIKEEYEELRDAPDDVERIDGCGDLIWVVIGYCLSRGWDISAAFKEISRSNHSKIDFTSGKILKREDGKILKPASYSPPDLTNLV